MKNNTGLNVSALFRNYLNLIGLDWEECETWGRKFNQQLEDSKWIESDSGRMFELKFDPMEYIKNEN